MLPQKAVVCKVLRAGKENSQGTAEQWNTVREQWSSGTQSVPLEEMLPQKAVVRKVLRAGKENSQGTAEQWNSQRGAVVRSGVQCGAAPGVLCAPLPLLAQEDP
eukprot:4406618-Pyramimonas_sp.AAC.1